MEYTSSSCSWGWSVGADFVGSGAEKVNRREEQSLLTRLSEGGARLEI
jgi:hypothetical protein